MLLNLHHPMTNKGLTGANSSPRLILTKKIRVPCVYTKHNGYERTSSLVNRFFFFLYFSFKSFKQPLSNLLQATGRPRGASMAIIFVCVVALSVPGTFRSAIVNNYDRTQKCECAGLCVGGPPFGHQKTGRRNHSQ